MQNWSIHPRWDGARMHMVRPTIGRVLGPIFFGWLPLVVIAVGMEEKGGQFFEAMSPQWIFVIVFWSLCFYCFTLAKSTTLDFGSKAIGQRTRHLGLWVGGWHPVPEEARLVSDMHYGKAAKIASELAGTEVFGSMLCMRLRLVGPEREWLICEHHATPPGAVFHRVRAEQREMADRIARGLEIEQEDLLDDEKHVLLITPEPGTPVGRLEEDGRNSFRSFFFLGLFGLFFLGFGVFVFRTESMIPGTFLIVGGLVFSYLAFYAGFRKLKVVVDADANTVSMKTGWFRADEEQELSMTDEVRLVLFHTAVEERRHRSTFGLAMAVKDQYLSMPGADSHYFADMFRHAVKVSTEMQVPLELNGAWVVSIYQKHLAGEEEAAPAGVE